MNWSGRRACALCASYFLVTTVNIINIGIDILMYRYINIGIEGFHSYTIFCNRRGEEWCKVRRILNMKMLKPKVIGEYARYIMGHLNGEWVYFSNTPFPSRPTALFKARLTRNHWCVNLFFSIFIQIKLTFSRQVLHSVALVWNWRILLLGNGLNYVFNVFFFSVSLFALLFSNETRPLVCIFIWEE